MGSRALRNKVGKGKAQYKGSRSGMRKLMNGEDVATLVRRAAIDLCRDANGYESMGYRFRVVGYNQRVSFHAFIFPADIHTTYAQAKYDLLQIALGSTGMIHTWHGWNPDIGY